MVKLSRTLKGESISVVFDCQDEEEDFDEDDEFDPESPPEDEEGQSSYGINFDVTVARGDVGALHFKCIAANPGDVVVKHLKFLPKGKSASDADLYEGPRFDQLSDSLKGAVLGYLEDREVDQDLSYFILSHSANKEQKEYENWLRKLMEFTDTK